MSSANEETRVPRICSMATRIKIRGATRSTRGTSQTFYLNLNKALKVRGQSTTHYCIPSITSESEDLIDFCSNDLLSLSTSGALGKEFLAEMGRHPGFPTTSGGSRMATGSYPYLEQIESEIAGFHGFEAGIMLGSGYDANIAIWTAIPRPGDVILYDESSHASTIDGMKQSLTNHKAEFRHNDVEAFRTALVAIFEKHPLIRQGKSTVVVSVEAMYSMDGDICPLQDLVDVAREVSDSRGNVQFVVDEAYSTGVIGPDGKGLVCELGLEEDIAVVVHAFSKAVGAHGAIVLGSDVVRDVIANYARSFQFTTAPPLPHVAMVKAAYSLLIAAPGRQARENIQHLVGLFFEKLTSHPLWDKANKTGMLSVPLADRWEERPFFAPIITLHTHEKYTYWLYFHLMSAKCSVFPVCHPIVPVGKSRQKICVHGCNTDEEILTLVKAIYSWVQEMFDIQSNGNKGQVSTAAAVAYRWMKEEKLAGFGMT